jgi:hypothetical protein
MLFQVKKNAMIFIIREMVKAEEARRPARKRLLELRHI